MDLNYNYIERSDKGQGEGQRLHFDLMNGGTVTMTQDANSGHCSSTVWDAALVLEKYFEKSVKRDKYVGKKVLELGSGPGLLGISLALLGGVVTLTDIGQALPLLKTNVDANMAANRELFGRGTAEVMELDWGKVETVPTEETYDVIVGSDCVYKEDVVPLFLQVIHRLSSPSTDIYIANEFRSQSVHDRFLAEAGALFSCRKQSLKKMHPNYKNEVIQVFVLKKKRSGETAAP